MRPRLARGGRAIEVSYTRRVSERSGDDDGGRRSLGSLVEWARGREEIRYLVVAGCTSLGYLGLVAALLGVFRWYMVAIVVAQVITIAIAFPVYRKLIFRSTGPWRADLPRFVGVWTGGFLAGIVATPLLVELTTLRPLVAQVIAVATVAVLSYAGHHFISFRHRVRAEAGHGDR